MTPSDYVWGSNGVVANYGLQLLVANLLQPNPAFVHTALENLHYLLGRNPFSLSYVTQLGSKPYRRPHHRPSGADTNPEPWPGLLSGGPNRSPQDPAMKAKLKPGTPPAKMYVDDQESYASNEVAINWQAPLVFLLAGVQTAPQSGALPAPLPGGSSHASHHRSTRSERRQAQPPASSRPLYAAPRFSPRINLRPSSPDRMAHKFCSHSRTHSTPRIVPQPLSV
jgi:hypothetical protein